MTLFEQNLKNSLRMGYIAVLMHVPLFCGMAYYFGTEFWVAVGVPAALLVGHGLMTRLNGSLHFNSVMFGFSTIVLSGTMIHLGKGMIEWHFHIFVALGVLVLFASPWTIVAAAATAAVHHTAFYFFLPTSVFNYSASLGIVAIHALFVVVEAAACIMVAYKFQKIINLQEKINTEISPLIFSVDKAANSSRTASASLLALGQSNTTALTEISSSSDEISSMVSATRDLIADNLNGMRTVKVSVKKSAGAVAKGHSFLLALGVLKERMDELNTYSETRLGDLMKTVLEISEKTQVINEIVFQTKLLSFNASVEAARAGEHGKGFTVVAEEVGNLARNSGVAAQEISKIVEDSKKKLQESVKSMTEQIGQFKSEIHNAHGTWSEINEDLSASFDVVDRNSDQQEKSLNEVSSAADQQSHGVKELSKSLNEIQSSTQEMMKQVHEVESISGQLQADLEKLKALHAQISDSNHSAEPEDYAQAPVDDFKRAS